MPIPGRARGRGARVCARRASRKDLQPSPSRGPGQVAGTQDSWSGDARDIDAAGEGIRVR